MKIMRANEVPLGEVFFYEAKNQPPRAWIRIALSMSADESQVSAESYHSYKGYENPGKYLQLGPCTPVLA